MRLEKLVLLFVLPLCVCHCGKSPGNGKSVSLGGNGSGKNNVSGISISGKTSISPYKCEPYVATRSEGGTKMLMQPSIESGSGGVYADSSCGELAAFNIYFAENSNTTTFYFQAFSRGDIVLKVQVLKDIGEWTDINDLGNQNEIQEGRLTVTVQ